jgi:hypothetical protein
LYPCSSETNIRPRSSQHTAEGDEMSGSLATTSMRKPSGNLNAAALCSGVNGFGASVGFGICARARFVANSMGQASAADFRIVRYGVGESIEMCVESVVVSDPVSQCSDLRRLGGLSTMWLMDHWFILI